MADPYGSSPRPQAIDEGGPAAGEALAAVEEWLLGRKRGLLSPVAVGTIDQLLFAATRTKHVSLRFAGLAGKVVILDEVHAADIYMQQFLLEALCWLGECRVPVVLLSATLAPSQRAGLMDAYLRGALNFPQLELGQVDPEGYPSITAAWPEEGRPAVIARAAEGWRSSRPVSVGILDDDAADPSKSLAAYIADKTREGGCALVLLNTVLRAQVVYRTLRDALECEVVLLHGRLTAADRAARTERLLHLLGPPGPGRSRPESLVVVATQVAEQSFDVDVDLLVTDLAPVDLLVQRAGRLHRHERDPRERPGTLAEPTIVVTGMRRTDGPPSITRSALSIYGEADPVDRDSVGAEGHTPYRAAAPLLRTAALVEHAAVGGGWQLPRDVPALITTVYGPELVTPAAWRDAEEREIAAFTALQHRRAHKANPYRLAPVGTRTKPTLEGIHGRDARDPADEETLRAVVRDGPPSIEVVLIERVGERFRTLDGYDLGLHGERIHNDTDPGAALGGTVRLPTTFPDLTDAAERLGPTLSEWRDHPWTKRANVLVLDDGEAELDGYRIQYDRELGLLVEPRRHHRSDRQ